MWSVETEGAIRSTPVLDKQNVYFGTAGGAVLALDRSTGAQRWSAALGGDPVESPVTLDSGSAYVGDTAGVLRRLKLSTGQVDWSFKTEAKILGAATVAGPLVLVGSYDRNLYGVA